MAKNWQMTIPLGDISTAYTSTGIPNIEVYIPSPKLVKKLAIELDSIFIKNKICAKYFEEKKSRQSERSFQRAKKELENYSLGEVQNAKVKNN